MRCCLKSFIVHLIKFDQLSKCYYFQKSPGGTITLFDNNLLFIIIKDKVFGNNISYINRKSLFIYILACRWINGQKSFYDGIAILCSVEL